VSAAFASQLVASQIAVPWLVRPLAAAAVSLGAVLAATALLGLAFLPSEIQTARPFASITHSLELDGGAAVSLVWSMPSGYGGGRRFHLAIQPTHGADVEFVWPELEALSLAKGPGADQALVGTWNGAIHLLDFTRATREMICARRHRDGVVALSCSADGRCLVSQGAYELAAWDLERKCDRWRRTDVAPFCFALAPDSVTAFIANQEGEVLQIDLHSGETLRSITHLEDSMIQFAVSPKGDALAVLGSTGRLLMLDTRTGALLWEQSARYFAHQGPARVAAFSPCGRLLVTSDHEQGNALVLWDAATGRRLHELRGHRRIVHGAEFTSGGELRSWGADGTLRVWDLDRRATISVTILQPPLNAT
jgi:WD40 repeat protein